MPSRYDQELISCYQKASTSKNYFTIVFNNYCDRVSPGRRQHLTKSQCMLFIDQLNDSYLFYIRWQNKKLTDAFQNNIRNVLSHHHDRDCWLVYFWAQWQILFLSTTPCPQSLPSWHTSLGIFSITSDRSRDEIWYLIEIIKDIVTYL